VSQTEGAWYLQNLRRVKPVDERREMEDSADLPSALEDSEHSP